MHGIFSMPMSISVLPLSSFSSVQYSRSTFPAFSSVFRDFHDMYFVFCLNYFRLPLQLLLNDVFAVARPSLRSTYRSATFIGFTTNIRVDVLHWRRYIVSYNKAYWVEKDTLCYKQVGARFLRSYSLTQISKKANGGDTTIKPLHSRKSKS